MRVEWINSIRAILALLLVMTFCVCMFIDEIPAEKFREFKELTILAVTFYFVLKRRPKENGGGNDKTDISNSGVK